MTKARDLANIATSGLIEATELATDAVTTAKIAAAAVTTAKITDANITTAKIAADAVDGTKIADDAINSEHITDASIDNAHMGTDIDASKIATGTFANARISAGSVTQHVTGYDDSNIRADISALALREATNETSAAFNLPNSFVDTFTDDTNLGTQTDVDRISGYIIPYTSVPHTYTDDSDTIAIIEFQNSTFVDSANSKTLTITSPMTRSASGTGKIGSYAGYSDTTGANTSYVSFEDSTVGTGDFTMEAWIKQEAIHGTDRLFNAGAEDSNSDTTPDGISVGWQESGGSPTTGLNFYGAASTSNWTATHTHPGLNTWFHFVLQRASGATSAFVNGTQTATDNRYSGNNINGTQMIWARITSGGNTTENVQGWIDHFRMSSVARYSSNFTPPTTTTGINATGTLIQSANTVGSAKTEVSGTMLYKDNAGTATLGTDLKIYFTCNGGTNWTEAASYNAITPVYATGIKQVRLGKTTCTSGTDIRYKAVWANQASGSKETQLHGIGINY